MAAGTLGLASQWAVVFDQTAGLPSAEVDGGGSECLPSCLTLRSYRLLLSSHIVPSTRNHEIESDVFCVSEQFYRVCGKSVLGAGRKSRGRVTSAVSGQCVGCRCSAFSDKIWFASIV